MLSEKMGQIEIRLPKKRFWIALKVESHLAMSINVIKNGDFDNFLVENPHFLEILRLSRFLHAKMSKK